MYCSTLRRKLCSEVYSLRYASSFLKVAKNVSATALSCGWPVAEKDCFVPHFCSSSINAPEVYCLPLSLLCRIRHSSDRGSQYTSAAFRAELSRRGMVQSLSGTGHCFDNARMESFFATLKKEKIYQIAAYKLPREQVKTIIFRYIFIYYNRVRVYTRNPLGLPPVKYREWMRAQQAA